MSTTRKLRLAPLLQTAHIKRPSPAVDAVTLIPHMLEAFIAGDRGFRKGSVSRTVPAKPG